MNRPDGARTDYVAVLLPLVVTAVQLCRYRHTPAAAALLELVLADVAVIAIMVSVGYVLAQALAWDAVP